MTQFRYANTLSYAAPFVAKERNALAQFSGGSGQDYGLMDPGISYGGGNALAGLYGGQSDPDANDPRGEAYRYGGDGGGDMNAFADGIASVESGGDYNAIGPTVTSGAYAGDRAYGKYQVMGRNLPEWTRKYLGREMSPQEFLARPDAQERLFRAISSENYQKYGNWEDVASIWFSGRRARGNRRSDGYTTVPEYTSRVRNAMGR